MKMKKIIEYFLVFLLTHSVYSQEKGERIYSFTIDEFNFYKYELGFKVKATKNFKAIKNETPEGLMQSIISCSNEEWNAYNTLGGKDNAQKNDEEYYNDVKRMDKNKNYLEFANKIEFKIVTSPKIG